MWKYIKLPLLCAGFFFLGAAYKVRTQPKVIYKDCTVWLEKQGVVIQRDR